jgi:hypothetical protein
MGEQRNRDIIRYFEYSDAGIEVEGDGLQEIPFGEFLVEKHAISRQQLFQALCAQDKNPGVRLGEVLASLGYIQYPEIDKYLTELKYIPSVAVSVDFSAPAQHARH